MFLQKIKIDISPSPGVDLCGFANRPQPSSNLLDPLFCKAILLKSPDASVLLIQLDLIGLTTQHSMEIRQRTAELLNLAASQVQVFCTHTHSGPCTLPLLGCGSFNVEYTEWLIEELPKQIASQLRDAAKIKVSPSWDKVWIGLGGHRRGAQKDPGSEFIRILSFRDQQQKFVSLVVNYAMHPVGLKGDQISADYPGYLSKMLEEELPGHPLSLFSLGPCGDIDPPVVGTDQKEIKDWAERMSRSIVDHFRSNQRKPGVPNEIFDPSYPGRVEYAHQVLHWPVEGINCAEISEWKDRFLANQHAVAEFGENYVKAVNTWHHNRQNELKDNEPAPLEINFEKVVLDDIRLYFVNAEIFSSVGSFVRDERTMLITLANGAAGYLPDREQYEIGGYEADQSFIFYDRFKPMPGALEALGNLFT